MMHNYLGAGEALWNILAADIKEQAEGKRNIKVDTKNVCLNGSAKAHRSFQVYKVLDETAAWLLGRVSDSNVEQAVKNVGTNPQL